MAEEQRPRKQRNARRSAYLEELEQHAAAAVRKEAEDDEARAREARWANFTTCLWMLGLALVGIAVAVSALFLAPRGWPVSAGLAVGAALILAASVGIIFMGLGETSVFAERHATDTGRRIAPVLRMLGAALVALILGGCVTALIYTIHGRGRWIINGRAQTESDALFNAVLVGAPFAVAVVGALAGAVAEALTGLFSRRRPERR
jgi:hypothetical protein